MKRSILLIVLIYLSTITFAQNSLTNTNPIRKMETIGYAAINVSPNVVHTSFVIKEYTDNGKIVTIKDTEAKLRKIIKNLGCKSSDISIGNIYGYISYNGASNEEGRFERRHLYLLKFSSVECIDIFLELADSRAFESFNIDDIENDNIDTAVRDLQLKAFASAKEKATVLLATYGEQCGRVLDIQEVNKFITYPDFIGKHSKGELVNMKAAAVNDIEKVRSKSIKIEYEVRIIFEIK